MLLRGLSARETESLVRRLRQSVIALSPPAKPSDPDLRQLQDNLSERLCARVQVRHNASGKGRVVIHYNSLDELDGIITRVK